MLVRPSYNPSPRFSERALDCGMHSTRTTCRGCGGGELHQFLDLGKQPLANSFLNSPSEFEAEPTFPLGVYFCNDCSLVQLVDVIDPVVLFRDYIYVSGTSESVSQHFRAYSSDVVKHLGLGSNDLVVDIASNDGTLLGHYQQHGVRTLGVEPATNIAELANSNGVSTINEFWTMGVAAQICEEHGRASVITANNVLAHVDQPLEFLQACKHLLSSNGRVVIEVPYLSHLIERFEYDTIYHEHLSYFSVTALSVLFQQAGLSIERIDQVPIHGGSLRIWAGLASKSAEHDESISKLLAEEVERGLSKPERLEHFAKDVETHRDRLNALLDDLGDTVSMAGYAAPAKGNTLLNYCGIDQSRLPYIVDKNPWKVGQFTPGTHIPVESVDVIAERQPDYLLILAWNMSEEIMRQQSAYQEAGGQFIVPVPQPRVV